MQLTNAEHAQVERIKNKIPRIAAQDPEYKTFGADQWNYQWPEPVNEQCVAEWEKQHSVALPREYRIYLRYIANGGPGFAYGLYPLEDTRIYGDIQRESPIPLYMTQAQVDTLNAQRENPDMVDDEYLFYDGLLVMMTEGCTYDIALVVNGKYRGRLIQTDSNEEFPFRFIFDHHFLDWYERWLDDFIAGMSMSGFINSVPGNQQQLIEWFTHENIPQLRNAITFSLGRFPRLEAETVVLWENICRTESDPFLCEQALVRLIMIRADCVTNIIRLYLNTPGRLQKSALNNLNLALQSGVDLEECIAPLLKLIPGLKGGFLFKAIEAIRKTNHNHYMTFLPFIENQESISKRDILCALRQTTDFEKYKNNFVELILPLFTAADMETVNWAIQLLYDVKDARVPPLVDKAASRFPELDSLHVYYYQRTWELSIAEYKQQHS